MWNKTLAHFQIICVIELIYKRFRENSGQIIAIESLVDINCQSMYLFYYAQNGHSIALTTSGPEVKLIQ